MKELPAKILEFCLSHNNRPIVWTDAYSRSHVFYEAFDQAKNCVSRIIDATEQFYRIMDTLKNSPEHWYKQIVEQYTFSANTIGFISGRGCGKTSAMLSFSKLLNDENAPLFSVLKEKHGTERFTFSVLPPIDPTLIDGHNNILLAIIAQLYQRISSMARQPLASINNAELIEHQQQFIKALNECRESIVAILCPPKNADEWDNDQIAKLADSCRLKQLMHGLVKAYLELMQYTAVTNNRPYGHDMADWTPASSSTTSLHRSFLVIQIDDIDMNFADTFQIFEYLRAYLTIPNVIVLLAADMGQLTRMIREHVCKQTGLKDNSQLMANQYIGKLLPSSQRCYLPDINALINRIQQKPALRLYAKWPEHTNPAHSRRVDDIADLLPLRGEGERLPCDIRVLLYIYQKTGILFLPRRNKHHILPNTFRGFNQLLSMLSDMEDVVAPVNEAFIDAKNHFYTAADLEDASDADSSDFCKRLRTRQNNVTHFRDYFLDEWCSENLSLENQEFVREFALQSVENLNNYVYLAFYEAQDRNATVSGIMTDANATVNKQTHTYGEVLDVLAEFSRNNQSVESQLLVFATHTYYSLTSHLLCISSLITYAEDENHDKACTFEVLKPIYQQSLISMSKQDADPSEYLYEISTQNDMHSIAELRYRAFFDESAFLSETKQKAALIGIDEHEAEDDPDALHKPSYRARDALYNYLKNLMSYGGNTNTKYFYSLTSPLLNCLYMDGYPEDMSGQGIEGISRDKWIDAQSAALTILLNWDVQQLALTFFQSRNISYLHDDLLHIDKSLLEIYYDKLKESINTHERIKEFFPFLQQCTLQLLFPTYKMSDGKPSEEAKPFQRILNNDFYSPFLSNITTLRDTRLGSKLNDPSNKLSHELMEALPKDGLSDIILGVIGQNILLKPFSETNEVSTFLQNEVSMFLQDDDTDDKTEQPTISQKKTSNPPKRASKKKSKPHKEVPDK